MNVGCLKYLCKQGYKWNDVTCSTAAFGGSLKCLKYLHENGCEWNKHTCENAARSGHLDCLRYEKKWRKGDIKEIKK
jgi:hypothetical protein